MALSEVAAAVVAMRRYDGDDSPTLRLKNELRERANIDPPPAFP